MKYNVALSSDGSIVAVENPFANKNGRVRMFQWLESCSDWVQMGPDIDGEAGVGDEFGVSVSLSSDGNIVAIGARRSDAYGFDSGRVSVFQGTVSSSAWTQVGAPIDDEATDDFSGRSVSL